MLKARSPKGAGSPERMFMEKKAHELTLMLLPRQRRRFMEAIFYDS